MSAQIKPLDLFVAPDGRDVWSGRLDCPNEALTDGPLATLEKARDILRRRKSAGELSEPVTVWLRGGEYRLTKPIEFSHEDSGPITYRSYPGESAVLSGARSISGFEETTVNGSRAWVADVTSHLSRHGEFRSLFVNGERRPRARFPKSGYLWMEDVPGTELNSWGLFDGTSAFTSREGDFQSWRNMRDIDVVVLHFWIDERLPVQNFDPQTRLVECRRKSVFALTDDWSGKWAKYYVENVFEAMSEPGEWYLDKEEKRLYYLPRAEESLETVTVEAPCVYQWLRLLGEEGSAIEWLRFEDLTFRHAEWVDIPASPYWVDPYRPALQWRLKDSWKHFIRHNGADPTTAFGASPQGAIHLPGAVFLEHARHCMFTGCVLEHAGDYAIDIGEGCRGIRIVGNTLRGMGAGGVKMDGGDHTAPHSRRTGYNQVTDNHIHSGGHIAGGGIGILVAHSFGNTIAHNQIHDFYYSGISVGWVWGYDENVARDNRIEKNHIYDLGKNVLSDMGGIYCLGVQPGTVVTGNHIHHVLMSNYGGSAIYLDEGSSHILVEGNVCHDVASHPFTVHYGRENTVRNNIFAHGGEAQIINIRGPRRDGTTGRYSFSLERNIIITGDVPFATWGVPGDPDETVGLMPWFSASNLFWSTGNSTLTFQQPGPRDAPPQLELSLEELQARRGDFGSIFADPKIRDLDGGDFTLEDDSPAFALGFQPIDISDVGPRSDFFKGKL